jgi:hypothetical protein
MIFSSLNVPLKSIQTNENDKLFMNLVNQIGIFTTILLNLPIDFNRNELEFLLLIIKSKPCFLNNLSIEDNDLSTLLLDSGLQTAFFTLIDDYQYCKKVLSSYPKSRIGIKLDSNDINIAKKQIENFHEIVGHYLYWFFLCNLHNKKNL